MKYVIGIDGGGTKSILRISDLLGQPLYLMNGGPTNQYATSFEEVKEVLVLLLQQSMQGAGLRIEDCQAFCLGSSGVDRPHEKLQFTNLLQSLGVRGKITITNDAETVLVAGSGKDEGIVIISGTGSVGYGKDRQGHKARAGGWGHIIGDEGSGYYIGRRAITAAVRSYDGRGEATLLYPMIMQTIGLEKPEELLKYVYHTADKRDIASFAKIVNEAYHRGDLTAKEILEDSAKELFLKAHSVIQSLDLAKREIPLVVNGSIFMHIDLIFQSFSTYVQNKYPLVKIYRLEKDAAWGAVQIALKSITSNG